MERGALEYFDTIDRMGGMVEAIEARFPQREIAESAYRFQQAVERKEKVIVGVNDFVARRTRRRSRRSTSTRRPPARQIARLRQLRADRDNGRVRRGPRRACKRAAEGRGNTMLPLLEAVRAYATRRRDVRRAARGVGRVRRSAASI